MKAIITGSSSGIGEYYAKELARRNYDIILVARRLKELKRVAKDIEENYKVKVSYKVADLSIQDVATKVGEELLDEFPDIVINNAGFGDFGLYAEQKEERLTQMINLNITAVHIWTSKFLKQMVKRNNGIIINTSSVAAFLPIFPRNTVYANTKVFVKGFSNSIQSELTSINSKVRVVSVEPGAINTNWYSVAQDEIDYKKSPKTPPDIFAKKVIKEILDKSKNDVKSGYGSKLVSFASKFLPRKTMGNIVTKSLLKEKHVQI